MVCKVSCLLCYIYTSLPLCKSSFKVTCNLHLYSVINSCSSVVVAWRVVSVAMVAVATWRPVFAVAWRIIVAAFMTRFSFMTRCSYCIHDALNSSCMTRCSRIMRCNCSYVKRWSRMTRWSCMKRRYMTRFSCMTRIIVAMWRTIAAWHAVTALLEPLGTVSRPKWISSTRSVCVHTLRVLPITSAARRYPVVGTCDHLGQWRSCLLLDETNIFQMASTAINSFTGDLQRVSTTWRPCQQCYYVCVEFPKPS